nr:alpha/beta hydrolase fold-3 [Tanacetum cinerariifolium]
MDLESAQNNVVAKLPLLKQVPQTTANADGTSTSIILGPVTTKEKAQKKNDVKARSMLLMALPNEHLLTFSQYEDAKTLFEAIQARFGGNDATKKTQRTLLKQMYENINAPSTESRDSIFNRLQKIRNKADLNTISIDVLYNNFKIVKQEVKRTVVSSSSTGSLNIAFLSYSSSTNEVDTTSIQVSADKTPVSTVMHEDLEQIHKDDLEEMDLKWQLAFLSMRARRSFRNQESRPMNQDSSRKTMIVEDTSSKAIVAIDGAGFDWSYMADDEVPTNMDRMAFSDSESLDKLIGSQITDNSKTGLGVISFNAVAPPPTSLFAPPSIDLSNSGLEEFQHPEFKGYGPKDSKSVCIDTSNEIKKALDAPIIKDWVSDSDEDKSKEMVLKSDNVQPKQANQPRKMIQKLVLKNIEKGTVQREVRPVWNNAMRTNHQNFCNSRRNFAPTAVLTKSGIVPFSTARQSSSRAAAPKADLSQEWLGSPRETNYLVSHLQGAPQDALEDQGYFSSRCSRHMTRNISYLADFKEHDGWYVAFGGGAKGDKITSKGTIRTGKLDFEDVYFVKELQFNLFSVSQMCDKKNSVLFTETECFVLSPNFKLADESQVLLKFPRKKNMYSFDMKNIVPQKDLTCLLTKATNDESMLWHRRLGHINFININKLVKDNLVRGLPLIFFENDQTCVACLNGKQQKVSFKSKLQNSISQPLFILHMDLFGPTSAEAVSTTYYVQNQVLVVKPHFKTPYELFKGGRPAWLFNIDALLKSMNYAPVSADNSLFDSYSQASYSHNKDKCGPSQASDNDNHERHNAESSTKIINTTGPVNTAIPTYADSTNDPLMPDLVDAEIFDDAYDDRDEGAKADYNNLETVISASPIPSIRIHKDHPKEHIIGETLVNLPHGKRAIRTKWVYRNKRDQRGIVVRNKARLVAQGHRQEEGIDYDEVFAHVAQIEAIKLFLAYASFMDFIFYQMDVKSAFLYGTIEEEVYVSQPPGFVDPEFPDRVYKVEKALYGLHQAPRAWYETLSTYILDNRFRRGTNDKTLFIKKIKDDILLVQVVKSASTLMKTHKPLSKDENGTDVDVHLYGSMIRSLMYLTSSRPDIMFVGQPTLGLWYPKDSPLELIAYYDSDYTCVSLDRKSTTGGFQFLGSRLISWQSKKQTIMANSITEVEYIATSNCCGQLKINAARPKLTTVRVYAAETKVKKVNDEVRIQSLVDGKSVNIKETSIRHILRLDDAEGTGFSGEVTLLFDNMLVQAFEEVGILQADAQPIPIPIKPSTSKPQKKHKPKRKHTKEREVLPTESQAEQNIPLPSPSMIHYLVVLDIKSTYKAKIEKLESRVERLEEENRVLKELNGVHSTVDSDEPVMKKKESSKQERKIADIDADVLSMLDVNDDEPAGVEEVLKEVKAAKLITEVVTTVGVDVNVASVQDTLITDAEATIVIVEVPKPRKRRGVIIQDPEETTTTVTMQPKVQAKDKGKAILIEEPKPLKKQVQIDLDREVTRQLKAVLNADINWNAIKRSMIVYLKNMAGYKMNYFKGMSYDEIRPLFKKHYNYNQAFLNKMNEGIKVLEKEVRQEKEVEVESSKREGGSLEQKIAKKQKMEQEIEKLKKHLQIVPDDDDVYTDATPLASKISLVDYKIHTERNKPYFKIIRADGNRRERFEKTDPENYTDDYLLNTLKIMFKKPNVEANIFLLVERMYPLTHFTLEQMVNDVRLEVDDESEMSLELLRLVRRQLNEGRHFFASAIAIDASAKERMDYGSIKFPPLEIHLSMDKKPETRSLPLITRFKLWILATLINVSIRDDGTIDRKLSDFVDSKSPANATPIEGVKSYDVSIDPHRNLCLDSSLYDGLCRRFARMIPAIVVSASYRLTPEHRYPSQYDDAFDVLKFLDDGKNLPKNADLHRCFVLGDSAGANLGHHVCIRSSQISFQQLKIIGLVSLQPFFGGKERTAAELSTEKSQGLALNQTDFFWNVLKPLSPSSNEKWDRDNEVINVSGPRAVDISGLDFPKTLIVVGGR